MRKIITLTLISSALLFTNKIDAQTETFSLGEIDPYVSAYMQPFAQAMATSMSGGWAHTAKVHSTLGFDVSFSASIVNVPIDNRTFNTNDVNMPGYTFKPVGEAPTISADRDMATPTISKRFDELSSTVGQEVALNFSAFKGLHISSGAMAAIQAGVGLPKGTEIIVRYIPDMSKSVNNAIPDGVEVELKKTGMWGVGVKHDIKQWIPVVSKVPFLQISGLFSYSKFYTGFAGNDLIIDPSTFGVTDIDPNIDASTWDNQSFDIDMSSFTGSLLVGVNIPIFQPFVGIGFNSSKFEGGFMGKYPEITYSAANPNGIVNGFETDPLVSEAKATDFNFQAGARLKLGFFVLHYQFTSQKYSMHTAGIAVTLR